MSAPSSSALASSQGFDPAQIERACYARWESAGYFKPQGAGEPFAIQLPPPNITGTLHMGHAFNQTIMDGLARYQRMRGCRTLWVPGTDHAGIATQIVVERQLAAQGVQRQTLGREAFIEKVWAWKKQSGGTITAQMRRVGCSADWEHEYFTMDEAGTRAVNEAFVRLYQDGLIYRGKRLVNWDPVLKTAVSDLEVVMEEKQGHLWHILYPFSDGPQDGMRGMHIATTRPETMLADGALAVHPEDARYRHRVGQWVDLPLCGRKIPIIADEMVDPAFGSGCVKITAAHDFNDYACAQRHPEIARITIFTLDAKINENGPAAYRGLDRYACRKAVLHDLEAQGFLEKTVPHRHQVPVGDRTGAVLEPMLTDQWFMAMNQAGGADGKTLAQRAVEAVEQGTVRFIPDNWVNTFDQWMGNLQDWCISRQLWWGHRIPAWYDDAGRVYVARSEAEARAQAGGQTLHQDDDVLDTWFSSALVPFSSLGWPDETRDMQDFLPSSVLVTGYEIIFFWVARMMMMSRYFTGKVPFRDVYIHGMVRDHEGKKMSKSEGNVIDPVDIIDGIALPALLEKRTTGLRRPEKAPQIAEATRKLFPEGIPAFGADALRFTMASYATLGRNIHFDFKRAEGYRNFCNKLWNATRFVLMALERADTAAPHGGAQAEPLDYSQADRWIIGELQRTEAAVAKAFDAYRFDLVAQAIYEFTWNHYCDWYLEMAKVQLGPEQQAAQHEATRRTLVHVLEATLRLAHPIIPFITEALWQEVAPQAGVDLRQTPSIMLARYPAADLNQIDAAADAQIAHLQRAVACCRQLRGEMAISPAQRVPLLLEHSTAATAIWEPVLRYLPALARLASVEWVERLPESGSVPIQVVADTRLMLSIEVDPAAEAARIAREIGKLEGDIARASAKLDNPAFRDKAPAAVVAQERARLAAAKATLEQLKTTAPAARMG